MLKYVVDMYFRIMDVTYDSNLFVFKFQKQSMQPNKTIPDGQRTKVIYTLIKDGKYQDVTLISILGHQSPQLLTTILPQE